MSGRMRPAEDLDASGLTLAIAYSRFHEEITTALLEGARKALAECGAPEPVEVAVPGAFELPLACELLLHAPSGSGGLNLVQRARESTVYGVIALGCVIRGETPHFDYVAGECARGLMDVQLRTGRPVAFGVLTCDTEEQARARAGGTEGNKGYDVALAAVEMALFAKLAEAGDR